MFTNNRYNLYYNGKFCARLEYDRLEINSCIIKKDDFGEFVDILKSAQNKGHFFKNDVEETLNDIVVYKGEHGYLPKYYSLLCDKLPNLYMVLNITPLLEFLDQNNIHYIIKSIESDIVGITFFIEGISSAVQYQHNKQIWWYGIQQNYCEYSDLNKIIDIIKMEINGA